MQIQRIRINALKAAPYNPRMTLRPGDRGWKKLERSLEEFDLVQPIVWNIRTGHVVSGHQRVAILKHRGEQEVECAVVDLSPEREQALNITLNNSSVGGDWDPDKLVAVLEELQAVPDFDPTLTGFDEQQLKDLVLAPEPAFLSRPAPPEESSVDQVCISLTVPEERFPDVETWLNKLLAAEPAVRLHVRRPE